MKFIQPSVSHSTSRELLLSKASTKMCVEHKRVKTHKYGMLNKEKDNTVAVKVKKVK